MGGATIGSRVEEAALHFNVAGEEVPSDRMLYAFADRVLPKFAEWGIRRTFPVVSHESDVTVLGMRRKLDGGIHGDLHCASVCASHRFLPSEFWGGMKAWRYMADRAGELASRSEVFLADVVLALVAGVAGALAFTTGIHTPLVGVMVAVALLPPLVAVGLLSGAGAWQPAFGAALLFWANLICINLAGVATFLAHGIQPRTWW